MKMVKLLSVCFAFFMLASCSNDEESTASEFKIVSSVLSTRAPQLDESGAGKFVEGDENTVFFHTKAGKLLHSMNYVYGNRYLWENFGLPQEVTACQVSACYPTVTTNTPESFEWNVVNEGARADFLFAAPVEGNTLSSAPVVLAFSHALHALKVELKATEASVTEDMLASAEITCRNFYPAARLNLLEGKSVGTAGELAALKKTGKKAVFMVPAQTVGSMQVVVKIGSREKV